MNEEFAISTKIKLENETSIGFAQTIEEACKSMCMNVYKQNINAHLLTELNKFKPAHMTQESQPLWRVVDKAADYIFPSALRVLLNIVLLLNGHI